LIVFGQEYDNRHNYRGWRHEDLAASGWHTAALTMRLLVESDFKYRRLDMNTLKDKAELVTGETTTIERRNLCELDS
jgi:acyl dehydratase